MTSTDTPAMTIDEMVESLTGFDEIAIEKRFDGFDIYADGERKGVRAMRALAFIRFRREGQSDPEAFKSAQELSFKGVSAMFLDEPEVNPEQPETPAGKDSSPPA